MKKNMRALLCAFLMLFSASAFASAASIDPEAIEKPAISQQPNTAADPEAGHIQQPAPAKPQEDSATPQQDKASPPASTPEVKNTVPVAAAASPKVSASTHKIKVNGTLVAPQAYNIDGYNYFKLRDIAFLLSGSTATFNVEWNASKKAINLISDKNYAAVGGEMAVVSATKLTTKASTDKLLLDGNTISVQGYNINGNNYFKIADLASQIGFTATFDNDTKTVLLATPPEPDVIPTPEPEPEPEPEPRTSQLDGKMTVIIDAGHGGDDPGAENKVHKMDEKHINLYVAQYLEQYLTEAGVNVIMVRDTLEEGSSLSYRGTVMEQNIETVDLFFGLHHNAANTQARGAQVLAQVADKNGGPSTVLANELNTQYERLGLPLRPIWYREGDKGDYYYTNRRAAELQIVAVISEFCFIDNEEDVQFINSEQGWQAEARAQCDAILNYFSQVEY